MKAGSVHLDAAALLWSENRLNVLNVPNVSRCSLIQNLIHKELFLQSLTLQCRTTLSLIEV